MIMAESAVLPRMLRAHCVQLKKVNISNEKNTRQYVMVSSVT